LLVVYLFYRLAITAFIVNKSKLILSLAKLSPVKQHNEQSISITKNKYLSKRKQLKSLPIKALLHIILVMAVFTSVNLLVQTHVIRAVILINSGY